MKDRSYQVADHVLYLSQQVGDEGTWWSVVCKSHDVALCAALRDAPSVTAFMGRGSKQRAERALRRLVAVEQARTPGIR